MNEWRYISIFRNFILLLYFWWRAFIIIWEKYNNYYLQENRVHLTITEQWKYEGNYLSIELFKPHSSLNLWSHIHKGEIFSYILPAAATHILYKLIRDVFAISVAFPNFSSSKFLQPKTETNISHKSNSLRAINNTIQYLLSDRRHIPKTRKIHVIGRNQNRLSVYRIIRGGVH